MRCLQCQCENPEGIGFCHECGAKLQQACPACGSAVPPGWKFCGNCGQALTAAAPPPSTATPTAPPPPPTPPAPKYASPQAYTPKHLAEKIPTSKSAMEGSGRT